MMSSATAVESLPPDPYSETPLAKQTRFLAEMNSLTAYHARRCPPYGKILEALGVGHESCQRLEDLPSLPVRLFKEMDLLSVPRDAVVKVLTSSGTSGQRPSRIFLDRETAASQAGALARIGRSLLGRARLPMLIVDEPAALKDFRSFSARGAGILGFSQFGCDHTYALRSGSLDPDWEAVDAFCSRHSGERILLFGFTGIVWKYFLGAAEDLGRRLDLRDGILIHGGGWKKLEKEKVSGEEFNRRLHRSFGISAVHNYYGLVEQTGSIFIECEDGFFHASHYSDVRTREPRTLEVQSPGRVGLLETFSTIPRSYPGHALLTEDLATIQGLDGCPCGRRGVFFNIHGRLPAAELRGCSDTRQDPS